MHLERLTGRFLLSILIVASLAGCGQSTSVAPATTPSPPATTYSITYTANGSTSGAPPTDPTKYAAGASTTILGNTGNLLQTSFTFAGWNTAANGSGTSYAVGATLAINANLTLYAQWTAVATTYSITYAANGGTAGAPPTDPTKYTAGATATVLGNTGNLLDTGFAFTGWNTAVNGSGTSYSAGATISINANLTLYAQWALSLPIASVWGGAQDVIALKSDGTVWGWGLNFKGEVGNGTIINQPSPTQVLGSGGLGHLTGVTAIMGGEAHNLALRSDGTVWAWGSNAFNQLGNGTTTDSSFPVQVSGLTSIVSLGSRGYHSLAVKSDGTVWGWGYDRNGALGNGVDDSNPDNPVPVQVQGVNNPIMVTAGYCFSVALLQNRTLVAWGANNNGQLGDGTTTNRLSPVAVVGLTNVAWVSAGWTHVVAVKTDGTVWTWGANTWGGLYPGVGKLGTGNTLDSSVPVQVTGIGPASYAWGGDGHTAVLLRDGTVWTFGSNAAGQLGDGTYNSSLVPIKVQGLRATVVGLIARDFHNQVILSDGAMWSWGSGLSGELGDGLFVNSPTPVQVPAF